MSSIRLSALTLAIALMLGASRPASAQHRTAIAVTALGAGVVANRIWHYDVDHGGYVDSFRTPDKMEHFAIASTLTFTAIDFGAKPSVSALAVCGAGWGYELTQGWVSWRDGVASCTGAFSAYVFHRLTH